MKSIKTGIIGGTLFFESDYIHGLSPEICKTDFGDVDLFVSENLMYVQRHGSEKHPPHLINHQANISALKNSGVQQIISANSVGSLSKDIKPGSIIIPDDYIQLGNLISMTKGIGSHFLPTLHNPFRDRVISIVKSSGKEVQTHGVYFNTEGPRFETAAEIRFIRQFADIVGMTLAKEASLAQESGMLYAALCSVDNYAHGISNDKISYQKLLQDAKKNAAKIGFLIQTIIREIYVNSD